MIRSSAKASKTAMDTSGGGATRRGGGGGGGGGGVGGGVGGGATVPTSKEMAAAAVIITTAKQAAWTSCNEPLVKFAYFFHPARKVKQVSMSRCRRH